MYIPNIKFDKTKCYTKLVDNLYKDNLDNILNSNIDNIIAKTIHIKPGLLS